MGSLAPFRPVGRRRCKQRPSKRWVKQSSYAVAATTERSPPATGRRTRHRSPHKGETGSPDFLNPQPLPRLLDVSGQAHACTAQISVFPGGAETGPVRRSDCGAGRSGRREAAATPGEYPRLISPMSSVSRNVLPHRQNGLFGQLPNVRLPSPRAG